MIAWILIPALWVGLISLILHDATKDDPDGSAVFLAAKTFWAAKNLRAVFRNAGSLLQHISSFIKSIRQDVPSAIEQSPAQPPKKTWWPKDHRTSNTAAEIELAIADAVKAVPGCENFIGVVVQPKMPESRRDPNWEVRGVRFGSADRKIANEHLGTVVARLQQEIRLTEHREWDLPRTADNLCTVPKRTTNPNFT
jgi:hypothetical protein